MVITIIIQITSNNITTAATTSRILPSTSKSTHHRSVALPVAAIRVARDSAINFEIVVIAPIAPTGRIAVTVHRVAVRIAVDRRQCQCIVKATNNNHDRWHRPWPQRHWLQGVAQRPEIHLRRSHVVISVAVARVSVGNSSNREVL